MPRSRCTRKRCPPSQHPLAFAPPVCSTSESCLHTRSQLTDIHGVVSVQALVTPERVDDYFINYLQKRPQLKKSYQKLRPDDPRAVVVNTRVNSATIKTHRKALADLWKWQKSQYPDDMADVGEPKTSANWKDVLANYEKETSRANREAYGPRGVQLIKNGYTDEQHIMLCQYGLVCGAPAPTGRQQHAISARVHWSHVWGHTMMMRHDDRTNLQLPDIGIVQARPQHAHRHRHEARERAAALTTRTCRARWRPRPRVGAAPTTHTARRRRRRHPCSISPLAQMPHQGPKKTPMIIATMDQGKTNKNGRVEVAAAFRHKSDPTQCAHFALARLFHYRYTAQGASPPDLKPTPRGPNLNPKRAWFDNYVNPGMEKGGHKVAEHKVICYNTCLKEVKFALAGIEDPVLNPSHYTHIQRKSAPRMAEEDEVAETQIRRGGRWVKLSGGGSLDESYLTGIPFELCRHTAGYSGKGSVFVMRAEVEPPPAMAAEVFPFVRKLKAQRERTASQRGWEWAVENDQFIYLMDHLAIVMLQDVAVAFDDFQGQPFMAQAPFNSRAFQDFRGELLAKIAALPQETAMETAEAAQARGDIHTAAAIREVSAVAMAAGMSAAGKAAGRGRGGKTPVLLQPSAIRQIEQIHQATVRKSGGSHAGASQPAASLGSDFDIKDPDTWPDGKDLPAFASAAQFAVLSEPSDFVLEYTCGLADGPAISHLEAKYGPAKRKGKRQGFSWRSKDTRDGSRALDVEWGKRAAAYKMIDKKGETEAIRMLVQMCADVPNKAKMSKSAVMRAVLDQITRDAAGFQERSQVAKGKATKRRVPNSPLPSPPESPTSVPAVPVSTVCSLALQCLGGLSLSFEGLRSALRWATPSSLVSTVGGDVPSTDSGAADGAAELPGLN